MIAAVALILGIVISACGTYTILTKNDAVFKIQIESLAKESGELKQRAMEQATSLSRQGVKIDSILASQAEDRRMTKELSTAIQGLNATLARIDERQKLWEANNGTYKRR
ncbi:hypothetical protein KAR91_78490 [Candidatus Pacearchaeota archaeon]|nr:hypothetical protein [Candidatus Pacearchaeota archaeon]